MLIVKDLKAAIDGMPDDTRIYIAQYGELGTAESTFTEDLTNTDYGIRYLTGNTPAPSKGENQTILVIRDKVWI